MVVEWFGKGFALDFLAVFPLYCPFDCLFHNFRFGQIRNPLNAHWLYNTSEY